MKKAVEMSLIGFGIVAALLAVAIIVFVSTFDINDYKDRITQAVKDETGRTLTFDGDMVLEFFPNLGVKLGGLGLSNTDGFGEDHMVHVDSARVSVRLLPLLTGDIKFGYLELNGLTLNLSRNKGGVANWDDLVGRAQKPKEEPQDSDRDFALDISGVTISNANLLWDDKVTETRFVVRGLNLKTGKIFKGSPFPVDAKLDFECSSPNARGTLSLSGKSSIDLDNREYGHIDMKVAATAEGQDIPGGKTNADMNIRFLVLDFNKEHAQITGLSLTSYGATLHMDATVEGISHGLKKAVATMTLDPFDAKQTLSQMGMKPPVTEDPKALTKVSGMAETIYSPGQVHLKTIQADLDGTPIVGSARYKMEAGEPFCFARLDVGELNLDRYLSPDHDVKKQESKAAAAAGDKDDLLFDKHTLRNQHLDIEAKIARLRIEGAWLESVQAAAKSRHGLFRISPLSAKLYGGSLDAGVTINATSSPSRTDVIAGLDSVNVGDLSMDVLGKESYQGILNFNGAISCSGDRVYRMLRSMNGKLNFHLADGVFPGVNLLHMTRTAHASKDKGGKVEAKEGDATRFGSIEGTGVITAGVLKNRDLEVKAPGLRANGQGAIILPTQQIDYLLKVKLVPTAEGQGGKSSDDLYGVMVPIRVAGTLERPLYWVSITEYVKALSGAVIGAAGSVLGGVTKAIKGVGKAVDQDCCEDDPKQEEKPARKKFLGIF